MKDSKKLFEAMSGIDEDLLARSEEFAQRKSGKKKIIPFIKYASTAAAAACAIFVIGVVMRQMPSMNSSGTAMNKAAERTSVYEATVAEEAKERTADDRTDSFNAGTDSGAARANEGIEAAAEADYMEEAVWDEKMEEASESETMPNAGVKSLSPNLSDGALKFGFSGNKNKTTYSFKDVPAEIYYEPVDSDTLKAPSMIPDRFTFNGGLDTNKGADLDIRFELDNEMIAKHVIKATANTWTTERMDNSLPASAAGGQDQLLVVYLTVDDEVEMTDELEKIDGTVLTADELSEERIGEIIQEQKDATGEAVPTLTFWVQYTEDTLIYFSGRVNADECMEILNSIGTNK